MNRKRQHTSPRESLLTGVRFFREHPQIWFTAFVAIVICAAFIFSMSGFARIAQDAQERYINDRAGWILDAFVIVAPDIIEDQDAMREHLRAIKAQNETITSLRIVAPHGNGAWRLYVSDSGRYEGTVNEDPHIVYQLAAGDPNQAYTAEVMTGGERSFITARAIKNSAGQVQALAVATQRLSEADRTIASNIRTAQLILAGVLILLMFLFLRHARIVDFATLYKKQLEVDEMKDSFISMASHELKSPLAVIRGYIEYLQSDQGSPEERQEYFRRIAISADELRLLVDDILDVSRIEMGRMRFSPDSVQPAGLIDELVTMFSDKAREKGLELRSDITDDARTAIIRVDAGRLKQVLINLLSNSIKYTLEGTVTISAAVRESDLELSVRDSGVGMTAEEQAKLFDKFYRVKAEETKEVRGTGLGLWITKYITEHMNGTISVESIKGEGSRFVVCFPLQKGTEVSEEEHVAA